MMRIEQNLASVQSYLENVGYCRFSAFFSHQNEKRAVLAEMAGRLAVGLFAAISIYDLVTKSLPLALKIVVHGTLLAIITSLGLSALLKKALSSPGVMQPEALPHSIEKEILPHSLEDEILPPSELAEPVLNDLIKKKEHEPIIAEVEVFVDISSEAKKLTPYQAPKTSKFILKSAVEETHGDESKEEIDFKKVRRNLLADFERAKHESGMESV